MNKEGSINYTLIIHEDALPQVKYEMSLDNNLAAMIITQHFLIQAKSVNEELRKNPDSLKAVSMSQMRKDEKLLKQTIAGMGYFIAKFAHGYSIAKEEENLTKSVMESENEIPSQNL